MGGLVLWRNSFFEALKSNSCFLSDVMMYGRLGSDCSRGDLHSTLPNWLSSNVGIEQMLHLGTDSSLVMAQRRERQIALQVGNEHDPTQQEMFHGLRRFWKNQILATVTVVSPTR